MFFVFNYWQILLLEFALVLFSYFVSAFNLLLFSIYMYVLCVGDNVTKYKHIYYVVVIVLIVKQSNNVGLHKPPVVYMISCGQVILFTSVVSAMHTLPDLHNHLFLQV